MLIKENQIEKKSFSFTYWVNGKEVQHVTPPVSCFNWVVAFLGFTRGCDRWIMLGARRAVAFFGRIFFCLGYCFLARALLSALASNLDGLPFFF